MIVTTPRLVADSARISAELGWEPEYDNLDRIVETAWMWHLSHPQGYADPIGCNLVR